MSATLIASYTVGSGGTTTVTLGSGGTIPQTYKDLLLRVSARSTSANGGYQHALFIRPNGATSTYLRSWFQAEGSTSVGGATTGYFNVTNAGNAGTLVPNDWTAGYFSNNEIYIPNYTSSAYKPFIATSFSEEASASLSFFYGGTLWQSNSAITSLELTQSGTAFAEFSTFNLYGII